MNVTTNAKAIINPIFPSGIVSDIAAGTAIYDALPNNIAKSKLSPTLNANIQLIIIAIVDMQIGATMPNTILYNHVKRNDMAIKSFY